MSAAAKILVVDDTPQNVKLLGDLLTVKGYAVVTAVNGKEALARIADHTIQDLDQLLPWNWNPNAAKLAA